MGFGIGRCKHEKVVIGCSVISVDFIVGTLEKIGYRGNNDTVLVELGSENILLLWLLVHEGSWPCLPKKFCFMSQVNGFREQMRQ